MPFKKGNIPWNSGQQGVMPIPWNKGLSRNHPKIAEICGRISQTKKLQYQTGKYAIWNKGKNKCIDVRLATQGKRSSAIKKLKFKQGILTPWNKGKKNIQIPWNKGKKGLQRAWNKDLSKETNIVVLKQANSLKGKWEEKYGRERAEIRKLKLRAARFKQQFNKTSNIEARTKRILLDLGCMEKTDFSGCEDPFDFICQKPINGICVPDFIFLIKKLIINCDGDYWHGNPEFFKKLNPMQKEVKERDLRQTKQLQEQGWIVLRFWEYTIYENVVEYIFILAKALKIA